MNLKEQGVNAEKVFHGASSSEATKQVYLESATLFSNAIHSKLKEGLYTLADFGSHKGEFLEDLIKLLSGYTFDTTAIDVNVDDLRQNGANKIIISDLSKLDLADKVFDITVCRYVLAWNNIETQKEILKEIKRVTKQIVVIQHQGANSNHPDELQNASKELFGGVVPELKRGQFFFSTAEQIERIMQELEMKFERVQTKEVVGLSDVFIDKYNLSSDKADKVREVLKGTDYVTLSAWVVEL